MAGELIHSVGNKHMLFLLLLSDEVGEVTLHGELGPDAEVVTHQYSTCT